MQALKGREWELVWLLAGLLVGGLLALRLLGFDAVPLWPFVVLVVLVFRPGNKLAWRLAIVFWLVFSAFAFLNTIAGKTNLGWQWLGSFPLFHPQQQPWWFVPMGASLVALLAWCQAGEVKVVLMNHGTQLTNRTIPDFRGHWGFWSQWFVLLLMGAAFDLIGTETGAGGLTGAFEVVGQWWWLLLAGILLIWLFLYLKLLSKRLGLSLLLSVLGVPYLVVILLLILVLKYLDGELPGTDTPRPNVDQQTSPPWKTWTLRMGGLLLILLMAVAAESFWWLKTTQYSVTETDAEGKEKEALYTLPTEYALQRVLWQLGMVKTPAMLEIKAGEFQMGSEKGSEDEKPVHQVTFKQPFSMSRHEITFAEYDYYVWLMQENGMEDVQYPHDQGWGRGSRPVINVSWDEAQGYVNWLTTETGSDCRLPTEAEWEYAARAGTTTDYFWGDDIGKNNANCDGCGSEWDRKQTALVGSFKPNQWGLQDMHGNVYEWVQDCWHYNYQGAPTDGTEWESGDHCHRRVMRGGAWSSLNSYSLTASSRLDAAFDDRSRSAGFRAVCDLPPTGR